MWGVFFDYFSYAVTINNATVIDEPQCSINSECNTGSGIFTKCCAKTRLVDVVTGTQDMNYFCINRGIAMADVSLEIDGFYMETKCLNGATNLAATVVALLTLTLL